MKLNAMILMNTLLVITEILHLYINCPSIQVINFSKEIIFVISSSPARMRGVQKSPDLELVEI